MTKKRQIIEKIISSKVYDIAQVTPIDKASNLSKSLKNNIFLKREDLQPTHSFKVRGSYNKIEHLYRKKNVQHVVTASAGNHAQGVAKSCSILNLPAVIVMPLATPCVEIKILRRVRPPRHRRDACSIAWRCRFLAARLSQGTQRTG